MLWQQAAVGCLWGPGISPFKCTLWVSRGAVTPREPSARSIIKENRNFFLSFYSFLSLQLPTLFKISVSTLQGFVWLRLWETVMVLKAKQYLVVHYSLKELSLTLVSDLQGSFTICKPPPGRYQNIAQGTAAKVCICGQLFCLKTYPRMKNYSYKLCHSTRSSREVSSELPGRRFNEVTLFLFLLSLLWVWRGRVFWSINAQMVLPAWNALPKVITVQDILLWFN